MKFFIIALLIILFLVFIKFIRCNFRFHFDNITFFQGSLGSGKTTMLVYFAIKEYKKRVLINKFLRFFNFFLLKRFKIRLRGEKVYSNFPILLNPLTNLYSYVVDYDVLVWLFRVDEDCIIVLDELEYFFPSEKVKASPRVRLCLTWFRHAFNCQMFCASQSLSGVNIEFRKRVNHCFNLMNCKRIFFYNRVLVKETIISEDIKNIYLGENDADSGFNKFYWFSKTWKFFNSRYGKNLKNLDDNTLNKVAIDFGVLLKLQKLKNGEKWISKDYNLI